MATSAAQYAGQTTAWHIDHQAAAAAVGQHTRAAAFYVSVL
jgi:hypothetical protein